MDKCLKPDRFETAPTSPDSKRKFSSVQSFFISATCRTKYLHQRNYTTEKGTCNKTKQRCNMQKLNKLH